MHVNLRLNLLLMKFSIAMKSVLKSRLWNKRESLSNNNRRNKLLINYKKIKKIKDPLYMNSQNADWHHAKENNV